MAVPAMAQPPEEQSRADDVGGAVTFSPDAFAQLAAMAAKKGKTPAQTVEDALSMIAWIDEALADGGSIVVRRAHGPWEVLRTQR